MPWSTDVVSVPLNTLSQRCGFYETIWEHLCFDIINKNAAKL